MAQDRGAFKTIPVHWRRVPPLVIVARNVAAGPHRAKNAFFGTVAAIRSCDFINACESLRYS
jgi:hypothetical protein